MEDVTRAGYPPLRALSSKHETYCLLRVAGKNSAEAARAAGFRSCGGGQAGYRLSSDPLIKARIKELLAEKFLSLHMDADEVLARAAMLARADVRALFDDQGKLRPMHELTDEEAAAVAGVETLEAFEGGGENRVQVGEVRKVRLRDPMPALRLLAEHLRLVKAPDEGLNALAGAIADRLKAARERRRSTTTIEDQK